MLIFFGGFVWVEAQTLQTINYPDTIDTFANSPQYPEKKIATNTISATENDTLTYFIITQIDVSGNKRTRYPIIVRELDFKTGDTLKRSNFEERIKENRNQIFNTGLFNDVSIKISGWQGYNIQLIIDVEERWYIYPMPIFQLTDRNFNV
ncbi:MAG TPA: POTRA domain-containing protein, partial [Chitinophagales bacterium]|nr:POTRA domain-containing protein [Chitinophagales bacterium]